MEAASENKRRGRPPKFEGDEAQALREHFPHLSDRQRQNIYYAGLAKSTVGSLVMAHLVQDPGSDDALFFAETADWLGERIGVLAELGRMLGKGFSPEDLGEIEGPGDVPEGYAKFAQAVRWLGDNKPKTKEAEILLRRWRLGKPQRGSADELHDELIEKINDYLRLRPDTPGAEIVAAVRLTLKAAENAL